MKYATKQYARMLPNCGALSPVSARMVGASTDSIWRWKNASQEHAAIVRQGTHICQVTALSTAPGTAGALAPEVDINSPCATVNRVGSYHELRDRLVIE